MLSVGSRLRDARETRGLSLEDVAQITKISRAHLEAIEADNFQNLPAPVFARGFVRSYGSAVGLDANELVRDLPSSLEVVGARARRRSQHDLALLNASGRRAGGLIGISSQVLLVLVAVSMLLAAWWMVGKNRNSSDAGRAEGANPPNIEQRLDTLPPANTTADPPPARR